MGEPDDKRWRRPADPVSSYARDADAQGPAEGTRSEAAPWVRSVRERRLPESGVGAPQPQLRWTPPPPKAEEREPSMLPVAIGIALLAVLACIPHWVAPTVAIMVACVGGPVAWGFVRVSTGKRRVRYLVMLAAIIVCAVLAVAAPLLWLEADVLQPLDLRGTSAGCLRERYT